MFLVAKVAPKPHEPEERITSMSLINREEARTWSKDRIHEEAQDLRRMIQEDQEEIRNLEDRIDELETSDQYAMSRSRDDRISAAGEGIDRLNNVIDRAEEDIKFLKSLL